VCERDRGLVGWEFGVFTWRVVWDFMSIFSCLAYVNLVYLLELCLFIYSSPALMLK